MKLLKRIGFYLVGVALGSILVLFIWKGKDVSFDYGMDARTLSSIRKKQILYSESAINSMNEMKIDSTTINAILKNQGDVDFDKSKARQKPCGEYYIKGKNSFKGIDFYVKRCDSTALIQEIYNNP